MDKAETTLHNKHTFVYRESLVNYIQLTTHSQHFVLFLTEDDIFDIALYDIDTQLLIGEYQMRNDESYQLLKAKAPNGKYVVSMYYDIKEEKPVGASDKVKSDNKVYAKLKNIEKISTYEEFLKFYDDPKGSYQLTKDIDFKGAAIKPIASFS